MTNHLALACFLAVALLRPTPAGGVEAILTDDASVHPTEAHPSKGRSPFLNLGEEAVYLRFDVFAVLPKSVTGSQIAKATIRLYANKVVRPGACVATMLMESWNEDH